MADFIDEYVFMLRHICVKQFIGKLLTQIIDEMNDRHKGHVTGQCIETRLRHNSHSLG